MPISRRTIAQLVRLLVVHNGDRPIGAELTRERYEELKVFVEVHVT